MPIGVSTACQKNALGQVCQLVLNIAVLCLIFVSYSGKLSSEDFPPDYLQAFPTTLESFPTVETIRKDASNEPDERRDAWIADTLHILWMNLTDMTGGRNFGVRGGLSKAEQALFNSYVAEMTRITEKYDGAPPGTSSLGRLRERQRRTLSRYAPIYLRWKAEQPEVEKAGSGSQISEPSQSLLKRLGPAGVIVLAFSGFILFLLLYGWLSMKLRGGSDAHTDRFDGNTIKQGSISATTRSQVCGLCGGRGDRPCQSCNGGRLRCSRCSGSGQAVFGQGGQSCMSCGGSGAEQCYACQGGTVRCSACNGSGRLAAI